MKEARHDSDKLKDQKKAFQRTSKWYFEYKGRQDLTKRDFYEIWLENHDKKHWEYLQKLRKFTADNKENAPTMGCPPANTESRVQSEDDDAEFEMLS